MLEEDAVQAPPPVRRRGRAGSGPGWLAAAIGTTGAEAEAPAVRTLGAWSDEAAATSVWAD